MPDKEDSRTSGIRVPSEPYGSRSTGSCATENGDVLGTQKARETLSLEKSGEEGVRMSWHAVTG